MAAPSDLDPGFGSNGFVQTSIGKLCRINALGQMPGGDLLAAGTAWLPNGSYPNDTTEEVALARYSRDGTLVPAFGSGGTATLPVSGGDTYGRDAAVTADGGIAVGGQLGLSLPRAMLMRFGADSGQIDHGFATDGRWLEPPDAPGSTHNSILDDVAAVPGGGILAIDETASSTSRYSLRRFSAAGSVDTTFGTNGLVSLGTFTGRIAVAGDGTVYIAGTNSGDPRTQQMTIKAFTPGGASVANFGDGGTATVPLPHGGYANDLVLQPDGKLVVAGQANDATSQSDTVVARIDPDGTVDDTFGSNGMAVVAVTTSYDFATGVALDPNGRVLVVGQYYDEPAGSAIDVLRFTAAGIPDENFGVGGIARFRHPADSSYPLLGDSNSIVVDPQTGRIVVGLTTTDTFQQGGGSRFTLMGLVGDPPPPPPPPPPPSAPSSGPGPSTSPQQSSTAPPAGSGDDVPATHDDPPQTVELQGSTVTRLPRVRLRSAHVVRGALRISVVLPAGWIGPGRIVVHGRGGSSVAQGLVHRHGPARLVVRVPLTALGRRLFATQRGLGRLTVGFFAAR
jgi:uncharacterized delta-60 repeat protein